jgi:hypothetical protein
MHACWQHRLTLTALLCVGGCSPALIPGTEVEDTPTNRVLMGQIAQYRQAVERRDADAILAMVSPTYFDLRGHPSDPAWHWNYDRLKAELPAEFAKVKDVRLEVSVRHISVDRDRAEVSYFFNEGFIKQMPSGDVADRKSDLNRMTFQYIGDRWLITSGL